ncbi:CBS domain-containing protein [Marinospirillum perlucidum]|uniref:CBS domain-containing protein n=1 Tax=Marinospirillum perlucidum TaxID=1982602 RepID=UPI000DF44CDA|nr:CBS domain-containing protein [Marinospirillum perlucidum]
MTQQILVKDAMSYDNYTVEANASVEEAAAIMQKHQLPGAPVVNERKELVGFVSEHDLLHQMLESSYHSTSKASVLDVMRKEVFTVKPDDNIIDVAETMSQLDKPKLYPVVSHGKVLGLITRGLLLKALIKSRTQGSRV